MLASSTKDLPIEIVIKATGENPSSAHFSYPQIGQALRPALKGMGFWNSVMELARAYECMMSLVIYMPIVVLSWFPFVSEFQIRLLFNQALVEVSKFP